MGTIAGSGRLETFQNDIFPRGLDLKACRYHQDPGTLRIRSGVTIRPGQLVALDANGDVIPVDHATFADSPTDVIGVAKWGTEAIGHGFYVDEPVVFTGATSTVNLKHAALQVMESTLYVRLASAAGGAGTHYTETVHYSVNAVNGTLTRINVLGAPALNTTVYATYSFSMTAADLRIQGVKFHSNTSDDVALCSADRFTVVTDWSMLLTTEFDMSRSYATTGLGSNLYAGDDGRFTNVAGNVRNKFVGRVFQLPRAGYPFLGVMAAGSPVVSST